MGYEELVLESTTPIFWRHVPRGEYSITPDEQIATHALSISRSSRVLGAIGQTIVGPA